MKNKNILLTGPPRCGKSILIEKVSRKLDRPLTGFYTREIQERGQRVGFAIVTLDGKEGILAHQENDGPVRVGKYGVDIEALDRIAAPAMIPTRMDQIIVIDEIGRMECLSSLFRETFMKALDSPNPVFGPIALRGDRFIQKIKDRKDVILVTVREENRDALPESLEEILCRGYRTAVSPCRLAGIRRQKSG